jgi:hypothetical protein
MLDLSGAPIDQGMDLKAMFFTIPPTTGQDLAFLGYLA